MRILIVCNVFPSSSREDPLMPAHIELARALNNLGHQVKVFSFCNPYNRYAYEGVFDLDGICLHQIRPSHKVGDGNQMNIQLFAIVAAAAYDLFTKFSRVVEEFRPDVIDCHEFNGIGFFYAREHKFPLVIHCYGPLAHLMRNGDVDAVSALDTELVDLMELSTIAEADGLIACSSDIAGRASYRSGRSLNEFEIVRVPLTLPDSLPAAQDLDRNSFPRLFYFGNVSRQKGADVLLNSLPFVAKKFPHFKLIIAGSEPRVRGEDKSIAEFMREKLAAMGLGPQVEFLNRISRQQIKQNVVNADICVFASTYETAGYACLEAVSYGGAVVTTAAGGLPEYHKHGESAWLVPVNSPKDLADGIIHLAENEKLRRELKVKGRDHVSKICDPSSIAEATVRVYETAIANFNKRVSANLSFQIAARAVTALLDACRYGTEVGAENSVNELAGVLLEHSSRLWREGYDTGREDGLEARKATSPD